MVIQSFGCEVLRKSARQDHAVGGGSACYACLPLDGAQEGKVLIPALGSWVEGPDPAVLWVKEGGAGAGSELHNELTGGVFKPRASAFQNVM